ncbi:MAG: terminase small subunit [Lachnospiraceae bacterium]|nr:terminase small subunit [Lachnospiraceae bacterium]
MSYIHINSGGRNIGVVIIDLTKQEKHFVEELAECNDIICAYKKAYSTKGLSEKEISKKAQALMGRERVAKSMDLKNGLTDKKDITPVDIMDELSTIAFSDISDYLVVEDGEIRPIPTNLIEPKKMLAVENIKQGTRNIEIKLYDKLKALDMLGKLIVGGQKSEDLVETGETVEEFLKKQDESFKY